MQMATEYHFDGFIPPSEYCPDFYDIEKKENCGHFHSPVLRVCTEGFDAGRRFLDFHLSYVNSSSEKI